MIQTIKSIDAKWLRPTVSSWQFALLLSVALTLAYNQPLWRLVLNATPDVSLKGGVFVVSFFVFLVALFNIVLNLAAIRFVQKPLAILLLLSAAAVTYFMSQYGVLIDKSMVQNGVETDPAEVGDLLSGRLFWYLLCLGLLPALLLSPPIAGQPALPAQTAPDPGGRRLGFSVTARSLAPSSVKKPFDPAMAGKRGAVFHDTASWSSRAAECSRPNVKAR